MITFVFLDAVAILAVIGVVAASTARRRMESADLLRRLRPVVDADRDLAATLGVEWRAWAAVRIASVIVLLLIGFVSGIAVLVVVLGLLGVFGVPWLVEEVAAARRVRAGRALVELLREVANNLADSRNLDASLRDAARRPPAEIRRLVAPLARSESMPDSLEAMAVASRSGFVEDVVVTLLAGRSRDPEVLVDQLRAHLIPQIEREIALIDDERAAVVVQRRTAQAMGVVFSVFVFVFASTPGLRDFLGSVQGQVTLGACCAGFCGLVAVSGRLLRGEPDVRWDVHEARRVVERLGRG
ncbi:MAG TPA: hypothetical protein VFO60_10390 [Candidatus Dormibacteraeota bacterium]|nr:hypothetical protein [Candidatus Dormibacteraeota bacterium]